MFLNKAYLSEGKLAHGPSHLGSGTQTASILETIFSGSTVIAQQCNGTGMRNSWVIKYGITSPTFATVPKANGLAVWRPFGKERTIFLGAANQPRNILVRAPTDAASKLGYGGQ